MLILINDVDDGITSPLTGVYAALPNLASAHEQGLADFEAPTWFAVFLPRGASEPIIRKLNQAAFATADTPSVQERLNVSAAPIHRDFGYARMVDRTGSTGHRRALVVRVRRRCDPP